MTRSISFTLPALSLLAMLSFSPMVGTLLAQAVPETVAAGQGSFQELMNEFAVIQELHDANAATIEKLVGDYTKIPQSPTPEAFLASALPLQSRIQSALQDIERSKDRQVTFRNNLAIYSGSRRLLKQEQSYISHYLDTLQKYGQEQEGAIVALKNALSKLNMRIATLPPPQSFVAKPGIEFVLVAGKVASPFYISKQPLSATQYQELYRMTSPELSEEVLAQKASEFTEKGISLFEARQAALIVGRVNGMDCRLPAESDLKALVSAGYSGKLEKAIWLDGKVSLAPREKDVRQRFGMTMGTLWDPEECLSAGGAEESNGVFAELPWATYPELGCVFVTGIAAGRKSRLAILQETMAAQASTRTAAATDPVESAGATSTPADSLETTIPAETVEGE